MVLAFLWGFEFLVSVCLVDDGVLVLVLVRFLGKKKLMMFYFVVLVLHSVGNAE